LVGAVVEYDHVAVGIVLSIHVTVAVVDQVLPAKSKNIKVPEPFHVNTKLSVFNQVIVSLNHVMVASTFPLVHHVVEYATVAVGGILSKANKVLYAFILLPLTVFQLNEERLSPLPRIADLIDW
jgi:hypothetical protein